MANDIRTRIAALRRKSRAAGSTEAEALAAAAMAARLMREHGLTDLDIEYGEVAASLKTRGRSPRDQLWGVVARCTNTAAMLQDDWSPRILYIGRGAGPEIAVYLTEVLNRAVDREVGQFKTTPAYRRRRSITTKRQAVHDFTVGLVVRLSQRLKELFAETRSDQACFEARQARDHRYPQTSQVNSASRKVRFSEAANAGFSAGGKVQLAHGVGGTTGPRLIGKD